MRYLWVSLIFWLVSCGDFNTSTDLMLTVKMRGNFVAPAGATGSFEPTSHTYELQKVILTFADGTSLDLKNSAAESLVIIDRALKIFEMPIEEDWAGTIMQNFVVQFSSTVTGTSLHEEEHTLTLPTYFPLEDQPVFGTTTLLQYGAFPVEVGKELSFEVYANWKSTVTRDESGETPVDTMENPVLSLSLLEQE